VSALSGAVFKLSAQMFPVLSREVVEGEQRLAIRPVVFARMPTRPAIAPRLPLSSGTNTGAQESSRATGGLAPSAGGAHSFAMS
jgi:hypothetical protein